MTVQVSAALGFLVIRRAGSLPGTVDELRPCGAVDGTIPMGQTRLFFLPLFIRALKRNSTGAAAPPASPTTPQTPGGPPPTAASTSAAVDIGTRLLTVPSAGLYTSPQRWVPLSAALPLIEGTRPATSRAPSRVPLRPAADDVA